MQDNTENQANLQRVRLYLFMHDKLRTDGKILVGLSRDAGEQNAKVGKRVGGGLVEGLLEVVGVVQRC